MKTVEVDVWGVCVSRDIFDISPIDDVSVNVYYSVDPCCAMISEITKDKLIMHDFNHLGNWRARNACHEYNHSVLTEFKNSGSKWIVIDLRLMSYDGYGIYINQKLVNICGGWLNSHISPDEMKIYLQNKYGYNCIVSIISQQELHPDDLFEKWCNFIKKRYGNNIILIIPYDDDEGLFDNRIVTNPNPNQRLSNNEIINRYSLRFIKNTSCHPLIVPSCTFSDYNHKWNYNPVHYTKDVYFELSKCISNILHNKESHMSEMILTLRSSTFLSKLSYHSKINSLTKEIEDNYSSIRNEADLEKFIVKFDEYYEICNDVNLLSIYQYYIGLVYRDIIFDEDKSIHWLTLSSRNNVVAKEALLHLLWKKGDVKKAKQISIELINLGNTLGMSYLAKMYYSVNSAR